MKLKQFSTLMVMAIAVIGIGIATFHTNALATLPGDTSQRIGEFGENTEVVIMNGSPGDKVVICHKGNTLSVGASSVPAHLAHGDTLGACP